MRLRYELRGDTDIDSNGSEPPAMGQTQLSWFTTQPFSKQPAPLIKTIALYYDHSSFDIYCVELTRWNCTRKSFTDTY